MAVVLLTAPICEVAAHPKSALPADEQLVADCISRSAGKHTWLEKTLWGLRDQEGGWIGAAIENRDGSFDLGPLQINSWWVGRIAKIIGRSSYQVRHLLVNDACFNVDAARWIFLSALEETRDYWKAVGVFHSPTSWRQQRYIRSVSVHLKRRFGREIFHK